MPDHPIFGDIDNGDLEAVKRRVLADATVLDEKEEDYERSPLMYAVDRERHAIAHWIIEHRGQHNLDLSDRHGQTALHWASWYGPLSLVQALVREGANPSALSTLRRTPLIDASYTGKSDIVAFLLQLPCILASIDLVNDDGWSAMSAASYFGYSAIVQLLLGAGADPTIPAGRNSPLNLAIARGHPTIAALLRHAIAEPDRARALHKARSLIDAAIIIPKAKQDSRDKDEPPAAQRQQVIAAAPAYLQGRVQQDAPLPLAELTPKQHQHQQGDDEQLRATAAFMVGLEGDDDGSEEGEAKHLPRELFKELLGYLMHAWAEKGAEA